MEITVKTTIGLTHGKRWYEPNSTIQMSEERAKVLLKRGHVEKHEEPARVADVPEPETLKAEQPKPKTRRATKRKPAKQTRGE